MATSQRHTPPILTDTIRERIRRQNQTWKEATGMLRDLAAISVYRHQLSATVAMDVLAALRVLDGLADSYRKDEIGE